MNVDEAMEAAAEFRADMETRPAWTLFSETVAVVLFFEVERLRAELAQLRKDWCDDDEAIKQQALRVLPKFEVEGDSVHVPRMGALAEMMAGELVKVRAELAAAKAASVCPVELVALGDADWECSVGVKCKSSEDADRLYNWLRDRTKDKSPPEA